MSDATFRILIVDDEPNIRSGLALALEEESYEVSTAGDATEAWALFQRTPSPARDHRPEDAGPALRAWTWCATSSTAGRRR